jgi:hypothetical protein
MSILVLDMGLQGRATRHYLARSPAASHVSEANNDSTGGYSETMPSPSRSPPMNPGRSVFHESCERGITAQQYEYRETKGD